MFGFILASAVMIMQAYVFWRAASLPFITRHIPKKYLFRAGLLLWVAFCLSRLVFPQGNSLLAAIEFISMTWMAVLFLISVCLLATELPTVFGFILPRSHVPLRTGALVIGLLLSVLALFQGLSAPVVENYPVYIHNLPANLEGSSLIALSDMHLGSQTDVAWLTARIDQVQAEKPAAIFLLGDIFEGYARPNREILSSMRRLNAPLGVWGVLGNHELFAGKQDYDALFQAAGIQLLRNRHVALPSGISIAGVDNMSSLKDPVQMESQLAATLANHPAMPTILLAHAPVAGDLAAAKGVDLMLSGHTHAGQIWPFGYLVKQRFPFFEGQYVIGGMTLIVSRGAGTWGPHMRLWKAGEITRIILHSDGGGG